MKLWSRIVLVMTVALLSACATQGGGKSHGADPQAALDRAVERWNLLIGGKTLQAWEYLSPGYRETHPQGTYATEMARRPVRWYKVEPFQSDDEEQAIQCDESGLRCDVRVRVHFRIRSHLTSVGMIESSQVLKESWIKLKGQWYHVPNDVVR